MGFSACDRLRGDQRLPGGQSRPGRIITLIDESCSLWGCVVDRAVFINYRGEDSHSYGALLYRDLIDRFGRDLVFLDAESTPAGADFVEELLGRVRCARLLLAVIGPRWLTATDPATGGRRIDDPADWIRRELAEAFAARVRVIPVLTDHANLPAAADLPADIAKLSRCQYRHLRRREPTADLARIATDLTSLDPALAAAAHSRQGGPHNLSATHGAAPVPRQLPAAIRDFTGRAADLLALDALLSTDTTGSATGRHGTVVISAIDGAAGIGKTTLAVYWGHRMRHRFPDGTLYTNLRGYGPGKAATAGEVLDAFLRTLGTPPGRIPAEVEERAALYRSLLDGRRVLVVLDNANAPEQVRPLLPAGAGCLALVTSRSSMTGLMVGEGATRINLDLLTFDEAVVLLRAIVGDERADAEPRALGEIARACGRLPLALRIAGARAAARPRLRLADLQAELLDQRTRLDALSSTRDEATAVRAVFTWSYQALSPGQALLFRRLGLHPGVQIDVYAAAALADTTPGEARSNLEALADIHLAEPAAPDRYLTHDLLRDYALERTEDEETAAGCDAAVRRLLGFYLHTTKNCQRLYGGTSQTGTDAAPPPSHPMTFTTDLQALSWIATEYANLIAASQYAAAAGLHAFAWQIPLCMAGLFDFLGNRAEWVPLYEGALAAALADGGRGQISTRNCLGTVLRTVRRFDEAIDQHTNALEMAQSAGNRNAEAAVRNELGRDFLDLGRPATAESHLRAALNIHREHNNPRSEAIASVNLGQAVLEQQDYPQALACFEHARVQLQRIGSPLHEGWVLNLIGSTYRVMGQSGDAISHHRQALDIARRYRMSLLEARSLDGLGGVLQQVGDHRAARECWLAAVEIFDAAGDPRADDIRTRLHA